MLGWCLSGALLCAGIMAIIAGIALPTGPAAGPPGAADKRSYSGHPYYILVGLALILVSLIPLFFD